MEKCFDGIYLVNKYGMIKCASWLLVNGTECAILEMPEYEDDEEIPAKVVETEILKMNLTPKYAICSHHHLDHCQSIWDYRKIFPKTKFIAHTSFITGYNNFIFLAEYLTGYKYLRLSPYYFEHVFNNDIYECNLDGEPLYFIHAPKHCESDILVVFKGVMFTSDWSIGYYPDCNDIIKPKQKIESIDKVLKLLKERNYLVHSLFSIHGNDFRYNIDFFKIMEETKRFAQDELSMLHK